MNECILNPLLERYHDTYTMFDHLSVQQIDTFCLCSYIMDCVSQVRSTEYSGAVIPAVRTLEEALRVKFQTSKKRARSIGAFVHYYRRHPDHYHVMCNYVNYPDTLLDRETFLNILTHIARYRGQAGHSYISRKTVARCLAWCAMLVNVMNTMKIAPIHLESEMSTIDTRKEHKKERLRVGKSTGGVVQVE